MNARSALQGAGVSALILFPFYRTMLDMPGVVRMHAPGSLITLTLSLVANLVLVSLVFMLVAAWLHGTPQRTWWKVFLPALIWDSIVQMAHVASKGWVSASLWVIVLVAVLLLSVVTHLWWPRVENILLKVSGAALMGLGFFCILVVLQLLHLAMWHPLAYSTRKTSSIGTLTTPMNRSGRPRVVWILFDELAYQQTFGDRYPNLKLPNFDELRKSSTLFTDTQPITKDTQTAVTSILLGQTIVGVNYTTGDRLHVIRATGAMHRFDSARTPFALARQHGLTTGVVGWYNPYCSILAPYLNQCYWTDELLNSGRGAQAAFWREFLRPWNVYGMLFAHPIKFFLSRNYRLRFYQYTMSATYVGVLLDANQRVATYQSLMQRADTILGPSGPDFVFVHLPLPHPPNFYNRKTGQLDVSGHRSYIDNLALTDKTLGHLLAILKQSPRWKNTSLLICGDHSWRTFLWRGSALWTPEDETASHGGVFDPRPMLMVHLAGQTTPATVSQPFPLLQVHTILDDLVSGKQPSFASLSTPAQ